MGVDVDEAAEADADEDDDAEIDSACLKESEIRRCLS